MSRNPFDQDLLPWSHQEKIPNQSFKTIIARTAAIVEGCEKQRHLHHEQWEKHNQEHHACRLEQALEREETKSQFVPEMVRTQWNANDDARFAYLTHFDQLLELHTHEDYLRGRRSWERRNKIEETEFHEPEPLPVTALKLWAAFVGLFMVVCLVAALAASGPGALLLAPVVLLAWLALTRLPSIYRGTFSSGGSRRGTSGNAV